MKRTMMAFLAFLSILCSAAAVGAQDNGWFMLDDETPSLSTQERNERAVRVATESLQVAERTLGPYHPAVALCLNNLADLYRAQGRFPLAEPLYKRSLAIRERVLGPDHPDVAQSLSGLAALYEAQNQIAKAQPLYKHLLVIFRNSLGPLPINASSQYLETRSTNCAFIPDDSTVAARLEIEIGPTGSLPIGAYLEVVFENPENPNMPKVVGLPRGAQQHADPFEAYVGVTLGMPDSDSPWIWGSKRGAHKQISVWSPEVYGLRCKNYKIVVNVYTDTLKVQLLGVHEQLTQAAVDTRMVRTSAELEIAAQHPGRCCQFDNR